MMYNFNPIQLQAKLATLTAEKEELIKAVEMSSDNISERAEQDIKVRVSHKG